MADLHDLAGQTDIYLLDQILRGEVPADARILDAGCGRGRNLVYFMKTGHEVFGIDRKEKAITEVRALADREGAPCDEEHFRVEAVEDSRFPDAHFDFIICNAVLHFAEDEAHFRSMVTAIHRLLRPRGIAFCRLASTTGIEDLVIPSSGDRSARWYRLPDGSDRFLVDLEFLLTITDELAVRLTGAIKTVNVQNRRCMSTWVWQKSSAAPKD